MPEGKKKMDLKMHFLWNTAEEDAKNFQTENVPYVPQLKQQDTKNVKINYIAS